MRMKTLPLKQFEREEQARMKSLNRHETDAYVLTERGKKKCYVVRIETFIAVMKLAAARLSEEEQPSAQLQRILK